MASIEELKERMNRSVDIKDPLERRLWVLAVITEFLKPSGIKPILVGGGAVEFYTSGGYSTIDMDIVVNTQLLSAVMAEFGFTKSGRHWYREDIGIPLEAPSEVLAEDQDRALKVEIDDMSIFIIGLEDLIVDRLNAFVHWQSAEDGRWAKHLIGENQSQIDWDYLKKRAGEEGTAEALKTIIESKQDKAL